MRADGPLPRAAALGVVVGAAAVVAFVLAGWSVRAATNTAFALGALVLGFGVSSWTAAVMLGPAAEYLQDYMDVGAGWTEAGARLAFSVLAALGAGVMLGSAVSTVLVRAVA